MNSHAVKRVISRPLISREKQPQSVHQFNELQGQ